MAAYLGKLLGTWLWKRDVVEKNQIDEIRYAFEIICSEFLEFLVMIMYGFITNRLFITFLYLIIFHTLREQFQGYHAKTIWRCFLLTTAAYLISMYSFEYIRIYLIIVFLIISILLQVRYCILHKVTKPIIVLVLLIMIGYVLNLFGYSNFIQLLSVVNLIVSISLLERRKVV